LSLLLLLQADLLLALGVRFDDRVTGKLEAFATNSRIVHIDIDPAEIHKNKHAHIPICAGTVLVPVLQQQQQQQQQQYTTAAAAAAAVHYCSSSSQQSRDLACNIASGGQQQIINKWSHTNLPCTGLVCPGLCACCCCCVVLLWAPAMKAQQCYVLHTCANVSCFKDRSI
jgi:TPP-dependent trihydroxycyclohexane-1,2-dione (THcHDO) dehydratase